MHFKGTNRWSWRKGCVQMAVGSDAVWIASPSAVFKGGKEAGLKGTPVSQRKAGRLHRVRGSEIGSSFLSPRCTCMLFPL